MQYCGNTLDDRYGDVAELARAALSKRVKRCGFESHHRYQIMKRKCIHGKTELQRCKLCDLRSVCCEDAVILEDKQYKCVNCRKVSEVSK